MWLQPSLKPGGASADICHFFQRFSRCSGMERWMIQKSCQLSGGAWFLICRRFDFGSLVLATSFQPTPDVTFVIALVLCSRTEISPEWMFDWSLSLSHQNAHTDTHTSTEGMFSSHCRLQSWLSHEALQTQGRPLKDKTYFRRGHDLFDWKMKPQTQQALFLFFPGPSLPGKTGIDARCDSSRRRIAQSCFLLLLRFGLFALLFFSRKKMHRLLPVCFGLQSPSLMTISQKRRDKSGAECVRWVFVKNFNHLRVLRTWWSVCETDRWVKSWRENTGEGLRGRQGERGWRGFIHFIQIRSRAVRSHHPPCLFSSLGAHVYHKRICLKIHGEHL